MSVPADKPLPWSVVVLTTVVLTAILVGFAMVWSATHPDPPDPPKPCAEKYGEGKCEPGQKMSTIKIDGRTWSFCRCPKGE